MLVSLKIKSMIRMVVYIMRRAIPYIREDSKMANIMVKVCFIMKRRPISSCMKEILRRARLKEMEF